MDVSAEHMKCEYRAFMMVALATVLRGRHCAQPRTGDAHIRNAFVMIIIMKKIQNAIAMVIESWIY
jgi:hypothetical protein